MAVPTLNKLKPYPEFQDLANHINRIVGELNDLLVNLDTINISKLNAKVIEAGTITAEKIGAGEITANEIAANTITANKMNINQLSAISADLGTITVGTLIGVLVQAATIIGSLIKTAEAGQRIEIDINGLRAMQANGVKRINISPSGTNGIAGIDILDAAGNFAGMMFSPSAGYLQVSGGQGALFSTTMGNADFVSALGNVTIQAPSGNVIIQGTNWSSLLATVAGKANAFSGYSGVHNGGIYSNGVLVGMA